MNQTVEFDFAARQCRAISSEEAAASLKAGRSCWVDIDSTDREAAARVLGALGIDPMAVESALSPDAGGRLVNHADCAHIETTSVTADREGLRFGRLDLILGKDLLVTIHRGPSGEIAHVLAHYERDFRNFAKSMGFMLYEIFEPLSEGYRRAIRVAEADVEEFQARIYGEVDDAVFNHVAETNRELLALRTALVSVRDVLHKLVTRRSHFVSETTVPFLESIGGALDRMNEDLAIARGTLSESLDLYMSLVSHRTNRVVTRLTAVNMIFLPLTFLCGVYGMNFRAMPEIQWKYGYLCWWIVALGLTSALILFMRRKKWL